MKFFPHRVSQLSEQELLCQAATALTKVTRCKKDYEPFIVNLQSLHGKMVSRSCSPPPAPPALALPHIGPAPLPAPQMDPGDGPSRGL